MGEAVDIFYRYGFFSLSVRVVPRDDHGSWIVREPTTKVFTPNSLRQVKQPLANKFDSQFQIFFCDDVADLKKHYFHDFKAEGVKEPYRLYTGSWRTATTVKYFGLSEDTLNSDAGFVLVKLLKPKDAVYQIIALDKDKYIRAKNDVLVEKKVSDFNQIYEEYLAPWIVKESGRVQAASGDSRVAEFLDERVVMKTQFNSYPSIFEIRKNDRLLDELEVLTRNTEAVIALAFRSIGALLPTVQAQDYYNEIVNTALALWEVNI